MIASIDVFFEFSSPYSYLAAQELPALAARHRRPLRWRPIELAKVWSAQGVLEAYAAVRRVKVGYIMRDAARVAADRGLSFVPFRSLPNVTLARLAFHRLKRCALPAAEAFVLAVWRKLFAEGCRHRVDRRAHARPRPPSAARNPVGPGRLSSDRGSGDRQ
jgi:2-hydroxychromene-2-carboxylate isomerase